MHEPRRIAGVSAMRVIFCRGYGFLIILVLVATGCRLAYGIRAPKNFPQTTAELRTPVQGSLFRDDFIGQVDPAWSWQNEDASRYKLEDGWLEITGGDESMLVDGQQTNLLWMSLPEGDLEISIRLISQPLFDYQQVGLLLYHDSENYISFSHGYCTQCVLGGEGVFLEYSLNGDYGRLAASVSASDLYLTLIVDQGVVLSFYAIDASSRQYLASQKIGVNFERVALSVTNGSKWDEGYDIVGRFDYFEIRRPIEFVPTLTPVYHQQG